METLGADRLLFGTDYPYTRTLRPQGDNRWHARFLASDTAEGIDAVANREADLAIINPSAVLTLAYRGAGVFRRPLPVRAVTVLPQYDFLMFAVSADSGLRYVEEIAKRRYPLQVSIRGQKPSHSVHLVLADVLAAVVYPLADHNHSSAAMVFVLKGRGRAPTPGRARASQCRRMAVQTVTRAMATASAIAGPGRLVKDLGRRRVDHQREHEERCARR